MEHAVGNTWYRVEATLTSHGVDEFDDPIGPGYMAVRFHRYNVVKVTPKGVRLAVCGFNPRTVLHASTKKFAYATKAEALEGFIHRKNRQRKILMCQVARCDEAKRNAERMLAKERENAN